MKNTSPLKYHGGKSYLAKWIRSYFPKHTRYCEPFFGGGSVLLAGDGKGVAEYANDKNWLLTTFWNVLRDDNLFAQFSRIANLTPLSQFDFDRANLEHAGEGRVSWALRFFIRNRMSRQGLGTSFTTPTSRLRRGMNEQVSAWLSAVEGLPQFHERLKRVEIRNQEAVDFIRELDSTTTLFYCDPPYLAETRSATKAYGEYEMSEDQHKELLTTLSVIKGKFILSGYQSKLYVSYAKKFKWKAVERQIDNKSSGSKTKELKTEVLWMNY